MNFLILKIFAILTVFKHSFASGKHANHSEIDKEYQVSPGPTKSCYLIPVDDYLPTGNYLVCLDYKITASFNAGRFEFEDELKENISSTLYLNSLYLSQEIEMIGAENDSNYKDSKFLYLGNFIDKQEFNFNLGEFCSDDYQDFVLMLDIGDLIFEKEIPNFLTFKLEFRLIKDSKDSRRIERNTISISEHFKLKDNTNKKIIHNFQRFKKNKEDLFESLAVMGRGDGDEGSFLYTNYEDETLIIEKLKSKNSSKRLVQKFVRQFEGFEERYNLGPRRDHKEDGDIIDGGEESKKEVSTNEKKEDGDIFIGGEENKKRVSTNKKKEDSDIFIGGGENKKRVSTHEKKQGDYVKSGDSSQNNGKIKNENKKLSWGMKVLIFFIIFSIILVILFLVYRVCGFNKKIKL